MRLEVCISVLRESSFAIRFDEMIRSASVRNDRVRYYIGEKFKLRENKKLRPILERLRNHSHICTVDEKPVALKWVSDGNMAKNSSNTSFPTTCALCDQCDPNHSHAEKNSGVSISGGTDTIEKGTEKDPESTRSYKAHRSQLATSLTLRHSSAARVLTNNDLEEIEDTSDGSKGESV